MNIRKYAPIARAIGIIGVVAGLVTAVTFAAIASNQVSLAPNTLAAASANLLIASGSDNCVDGGSTTSAPGLTATNLVPGVASAPNPFCIRNRGTIPLTITASIPQGVFTSGINPADVTLTLNCGVGNVLSGPLTAYSSPVAFPNQLAASSEMDCNETATLSSSYSDATGMSVPTFEVDFVGNQ